APTAARYPVLIFEPGLGNISTQYTTLLEDLGSHGYIIFAITPTYSSDVVVFPDGRVADATSTGNLDKAANLQAAGNQLVTTWAPAPLPVAAHSSTRFRRSCARCRAAQAITLASKTRSTLTSPITPSISRLCVPSGCLVPSMVCAGCRSYVPTCASSSIRIST